MNARESENYLAISRSSSTSKSVEIFGPRYIGDDFFLGPNLVSCVQSSFQGSAVLTLVSSVL